MTEAPSLSDAAERERILALHSLGILDTEFEERFDRITRLAASLFDVPIVAVSLVDVNRQWFKSCIGLDGREDSRDISFCAHAILRDEQLIVEDAQKDPRFAGYGNVTGEPHIRFYAGQPLYLPSGLKPGTLCVIDTKPRSFSAAEQDLLRDLAALVERELAFESAEEVFSELVRSSGRLRGVMTAAPDGIVVLDTEGAVELVNPAAERILGAAPDQLLGERLHEALHGTSCDGNCELCAAIAAPDSLARRENFVRANGNQVPVEFAIEAVRERDSSTGSVLTFREISERLELERMKEEFFAQVTHDLRSPLTAIAGFTRLVADAEAGPVSAEQQQMLERSLANTRRLEGLIDNLLAVARLERPEFELIRASVDLLVEANELVRQLEPIAALRGIAIEVEGEGPVAVDGDRALIGRALTNLISNAIKFSPDGGTIRVAVSAGERTCAVAVADRGPGIPEGEIAQLGTRFFRASTGERLPGTGLGLAITREIAELHGGALRIESTLGEGSTFTLELAR